MTRISTHIFARVSPVALLMGILNGCMLWTVPPESARITGYVTLANAGEPVAGTRISARSSGGFSFITQTDSQGYFSLYVRPDTYELTLKKSDYAGSQVTGVRVAEDDHVELKIIQPRAFNPAWATQPPQIELKGVEDGDAFAGPIPYQVTVTGENDVYVIYAALGKTPGAAFLTGPREAFFATPDTGEQALDPVAYGMRGPTTFEVVVYDLNGNRTHLIRHIRVLPPGGLPAPTDVKAISVTVGRRIDYLSRPRQIARPALEPIVIQTVPANANVFVQLRWQPVPRPGVTRYRIYRSFDGKDFEEAGTVPAARASFLDGHPRLGPHRRVFYRVAALTGLEEGVRSPAVETVPLEPFDVILTEPKDNAVDVARVPTFKWKPTKQVGNVYAYGAVLYDTVQGSESWWITPEPPRFLINQTEYKWNEDGRFTGTPWETLQPHRKYEWQVAYAVAMDNQEDPRAISIAIDRFGAPSDWPSFPTGLSARDNFSFSTGDYREK
jgi:hypothetical protein